MAVEREDTGVGFGTVSRVKGRIFKAISFSASIFGILMLAVLLAYVVMDAFDLSNASPEWLLTYYITLVLPLIGFSLYSVGDRGLTQHVIVMLAGGLVAVAAVFTGFEALIRQVPGITWQLTYLFVVAVPVTGYVVFRGSQEQTGQVGFGLIGRLLAGIGVGIALGIPFFVFDPTVWFYAFTCGVGFAGLAYLAGRVRPVFGELLVPAGFVGVVFGTLLRVQMSLYPSSETMFLLVSGLPLAVTASALVTRNDGRPIAAAFAFVVPLSVAGYGVVSAEDIWTVPAAAATVVAAIALTTILLAVYSLVDLSVSDRTIQFTPETAVGSNVPLYLVGGTLGGAALVAVAERAFRLLLEWQVTVYPDQELIFFGTFAIPLAVAVGALAYTRDESRPAATIVGVIPLAAGLVGLTVLSDTVLPAGTMVIFFAVAAAVVSNYVHQVVSARDGVAGLLLPVLLVAGVVLGRTIVEQFGFTKPESWLHLSYVTSPPSVIFEQEAGLFPAIVGSVIIVSMVAILSFVLGVGTAVFLEEYTSNTGWVGRLTRLIQVNIANLAAVPSIVYGLLGLAIFANLLGFGFGTAVTASLTLTLLILPITIVSAQEAIRAVPDDMRRGSDAMGATRWQTTKNVVLPQAFPGILTGIILALGRAIGETAPLIAIGAATSVFNPPTGLDSKLGAMPMQIFNWSTNPDEVFRYGVLAAGVVTLLIVLIAMNATAIILRNRAERDT
jgi:phosphate transport system permease protein